MVLFFMHIPFVVNHTINATGEVVTLYITVAFGGHFESGNRLLMEWEPGLVLGTAGPN